MQLAGWASLRWEDFNYLRDGAVNPCLPGVLCAPAVSSSYTEMRLVNPCFLLGFVDV